MIGMRRFIRRMVGLALAMGVYLGSSSTCSLASDFNFKVDTDVSKILEVIANLGKFNVIVSPNVRNKMTLNLKGVDPLEAMYLVANIHGLKIKKIDMKGAGGPYDTYAIAQPDTIEKGFEQGYTKTIRLRYAKAEDVAGVLSKGLGKDVNVNVEKDARTNSLILRGTEEILNKVDSLIKELDLPVPQVILDAKVVTIDTSFTRQLGFVWNWGVGKTASADVSTKNAGSGQVVAMTEFQRTQANSTYYDSPGTAKGSNLFQFGDFFRQNLFFNSSFAALETSSLTRTLAAPRLLAINGAQAQLRIGDKIVFSGGPSQPPEERDTGLVLDVTPRINKDNFITMVINVEQSTPDFSRGEYPTIKRTNTKTEVQVRDGEEILVGGLVTETDPSSETKVPFLGDLPLIKHLFRQKLRQPTGKELVILITPHVVKMNVAAQEPPASESPTTKGPSGIDDLDALDNGKASPAPASPGPTPKPSASIGPDIDLEGL